MNVDMNKIKELKKGYRAHGYIPSDLEIAANYWHEYLTREEKADILGSNAGRWSKERIARYRECIMEIAESLIE